MHDNLKMWFPVWIWDHIQGCIQKNGHGQLTDLTSQLSCLASFFLYMSLFGYPAFKSRQIDLVICFTFSFLNFVSDSSLQFLLVHIDLVWFAFTVLLTHSWDYISIYDICVCVCVCVNEYLLKLANIKIDIYLYVFNCVCVCVCIDMLSVFLWVWELSVLKQNCTRRLVKNLCKSYSS